MWFFLSYLQTYVTLLRQAFATDHGGFGPKTDKLTFTTRAKQQGSSENKRLASDNGDSSSCIACVSLLNSKFPQRSLAITVNHYCVSLLIALAVRFPRLWYPSQLALCDSMLCPVKRQKAAGFLPPVETGMRRGKKIIKMLIEKILWQALSTWKWCSARKRIHRHSGPNKKH